MKNLNTSISITPPTYTYFSEIFAFDFHLSEYLQMLERHPLIEIVSFTSTSSCGGNPEIFFRSTSKTAIQNFLDDYE